MIIQKGLEIKWDGGVEYIQLDIDSISASQDIIQTTEWWYESKEFVSYNTTATIKCASDNMLELEIRYQHDLNKHINFDDACWGTSTIRIYPNKKNGFASWRDDNDSSQNGNCPFKVVSRKPLKQIVRVPKTQIQRNQDKFKRVLFSIDRKCVISGETQYEVLEAAHIIPSSLGGPEYISNGIILRSDLHRLFDSMLIDLSPNGELSINKDVTETYKTDLTGLKLPENTFKRIKNALIGRNR